LRYLLKPMTAEVLQLETVAASFEYSPPGKMD